MRRSQSRLVRLVLAGVLHSVTGLANVELTVTNPNGTARVGCATAELAELGLADVQIGSVVDKSTGKELPFQVGNGRLAVVATLPAYATHVLAAKVERGSAAGKLTIDEDEATLSVKTSLYTLTLDKARGHVLKCIRDNRRKRDFKLQHSGLTLFREAENEKYIKRWMGVPTRYDQAKAKVRCTVIERGPLVAKLRLSWETAVGGVEETLTFVDGMRTVRHACKLRTTKPVINAKFHMSMWGFSSGRSEGLLYPEGRRFTGLWDVGYCRPTPGYRYAYNPKRRSGFGLVTHDAAGTDYFHFFMRGTQEGWGGDHMRLELYTRTLRWDRVPGALQFDFSIMIGGTPEEAARLAGKPAAPFTLGRGGGVIVTGIGTPGLRGAVLARRENALKVSLASAKPGGRLAVQVDGRPLFESGVSAGAAGKWTPKESDLGWHDLTISLAGRTQTYRVEVSRPVTIEKVWPPKLIHRLGELAKTEVVLQSHSTGVESVGMVSEVISGIDEIRVADRRQVVLQPSERRQILVDWNSGEREYGLTFRVKLLDGDRLIDEAEEYTSATNFAPKVAQVGIYNPSCRQEGSEHSWMQQMREKGFGIVEYYCWMPDELLNLTPDGDKWHPHTESQGAYEVTLTKKFLKTLVGEAHKRGVHVYAMDSGMLSLPGILDRPELVKYTPDGQPWIYCGRIQDGERRYAVGVSNPYTREFVKEWAEEMAASVDLFGWDGCRWDWGFVPSKPTDPLHWEETEEEKEKRKWYDSTGVPSTKLFPDPDGTGAELLHRWRETVNKRHPSFVYGTNGGASAEHQRSVPRYFKESSTHSLLLFEYLLSSVKEEHNTWAKWAEVMTEATQRVRVNGAQPCVGYKAGTLAGGIARRMSAYLMFASGCHWAKGAGQRHSLDELWKQFRFALRFSEYYYDPGFRLLPADRRDEVGVQAHPRVFWKQFVYERVRPAARDVTVHLLNLPENDYIVMHHEVPTVKENIAVSLKLKPGEKLKRASIMLPDPLPHAEPLKCSIDAGTAMARVPRLETAAIVLLEVTR